MRAGVLTGVLLAALGAWSLAAQQPATLTLPVGGGAVATGDLNGDGSTDIATSAPGAVAVYLGDGRGRFRPAPGSPFPAGDNPSDLALSDFNKDGRLDIAVANHETTYLSVLLGAANGFSQPRQTTVPSRPHPHGVAAGDFNRDGHLDLATESWGENLLLILHGNATASFAGEPRRITVGRVPYHKLRTADLNSDGAEDLVTTNHEGSSFSVACSRGRTGLTEAAVIAIPESPFAVAIGDVTGDRVPDLAIAHRSGSSANSARDRLTVLIGIGDCTFRSNPESAASVGRSPTAVAIGDVNGDGIGDIAVANIASNDVSVFLGSRAGFRSAGSPLPTGTGPTAIALADLNGDGKADIITGNSGSGDLSIRFSPY